MPLGIDPGERVSLRFVSQSACTCEASAGDLSRRTVCALGCCLLGLGRSAKTYHNRMSHPLIIPLCKARTLGTTILCWHAWEDRRQERRDAPHGTSNASQLIT